MEIAGGGDAEAVAGGVLCKVVALLLAIAGICGLHAAIFSGIAREGGEELLLAGLIQIIKVKMGQDRHGVVGDGGFHSFAKRNILDGAFNVGAFFAELADIDVEGFVYGGDISQVFQLLGHMHPADVGRALVFLLQLLVGAKLNAAFLAEAFQDGGYVAFPVLVVFFHDPGQVDGGEVVH